MILKYKTPNGFWAYEEADMILNRGVLILPVVQEYRVGGGKYEKYTIDKMNAKDSSELESIELNFFNEWWKAINDHVKHHTGIITDISYRTTSSYLVDIDAIDVIVLVKEGKQDKCIAFGCEGKDKQEVYILNDSGKTIERIG